MKHLVVVAALLVAAYGIPPEILEKIRETIHQLADECKAEVGTSDDDLAPIKSYQVPTTHKGKCFVACMNKKFGVQDQAGKISAEGMYATINKMKPIDAEFYKKTKKVVDVCLAEVAEGADECETAAYNMATCVRRENEVVGIKPIDINI